MNLKITTQDDFKMAEVLVECAAAGQGLKSLHPFADERFL